ncbi:hypothetical protein PG993_006852 [Apiospora rasikravindrae]|uniref:Uncharacterized protein n=1 Tax=Apiospora rasikravindrae TaxID=990691 RepID=A0ABR1SVT9_9PEZI
MPADTLALDGKVAIVTGSGRENGIGAGIARALARNGASVAIHYVSESTKPRAEKLAAEISKELDAKTAVVQGAVEEPGTADRIVQETLKAFHADSVDILVNNAGTGTIDGLMDATPKLLNDAFGVNVYGTLYMSQAVVGTGKMPQGGRIINVGSISSKTGPNQTGIYAAAKAAQDSMTTSLAGELGVSRGITVNSVGPGPVLTDLAKPVLQPDGNAGSFQESLVSRTRAAARVGTVEDIADAVLLLVSEKSRWITAQWISVSGGITGSIENEMRQT